MTINKEKLISLLVDKTDQDREQIEQQLSELINRIKKAAEAGKSFEIEGFGTFTMEEGVLHFEPSSTLETEINNRYAGMKPIELIGAFKEPGGGDIPDVSTGSEEEGDIWGIEKEADSDVSASGEAEEAEHEKVSEDPANEEKAGEAKPTPEDIIKRAEELAGKKTVAEEKEPGPSGQPIGMQISASAGDGEKEKNEEDPIGRFLVAAVVVLTIGIAGWFTYDMGFLSTSSSKSANNASTMPPAVQQQEPSDVGTNAGENDSPPNGENPSQSQEEELMTSDEVTNNADDGQVQEEVGDGSPYGLFETADADANVSGGYTIVVHSLRRQYQAAAIRDRLNEEGYRTVISEATVNGETYFRVGVGRFENVADALEAVAQLPDIYKDNHFIRRI